MPEIRQPLKVRSRTRPITGEDDLIGGAYPAVIIAVKDQNAVFRSNPSTTLGKAVAVEIEMRGTRCGGDRSPVAVPFGM